MKSIIYTVFIAILAVFLTISATSFATDDETYYDDSGYAEESSRHGFYLSGLGLLGYEALETTNFSMDWGIRAGRGISEFLIVGVEGAFGYTHQKDRKDIMLMDAKAFAQYYLWDNFYFNLGVGGVYGRVQTKYMTASATRTGISASGGFGYEFRIFPRFVFGPEARVNYRRLAGMNYLVAELGAVAGWHF